MTSEFGLLSAFLIGVAGSVHCVGMCGGIVGAFTMLLPKEKSHWPFMVAYNSGRILSYALAGGITGYLGAVLSHKVSFGLNILQLISGLFLLLLGLYLGNWWRVLSHLESLGSHVWKRISPMSKRFLPMKSALQAFPYGVIWGWLPCGLVYSTLTWSMASGSAINGALTMFAFGLGTLPALFALGGSTASIKTLLSRDKIRQSIAFILIIYALILLVQGVDNVIHQ